MSSIPFSYYLYQSLKRYGVFFAEKQIECCLALFYIWAAFCTVLTIVAEEVQTAQKPVSGSNLFPVPASSEAGFSDSL